MKLDLSRKFDIAKVWLTNSFDAQCDLVNLF